MVRYMSPNRGLAARMRAAIGVGVTATVLSLAAFAAMGVGIASADDGATPTPTAVVTSTAPPVPTATAVPTDTPTPVPSTTPTATPVPTVTAVPTATAPAATPTPLPAVQLPPIDSSPYAVTGPHPWLIRLLNRETNLLNSEQTRLNMAGSVVSLIQGFINDQNARGKDTSGLQAALAQFQTNIAAAQSHHDNAQSYLNSKLGFDSSGQVVDVQLARGTLRAAGLAEQRFQYRMDRALHDCFVAIIRWEEAGA